MMNMSMDRVWHKLYEEGVPASVDVAPFDSLVASFNDFCSKFEDKVAFSNFEVKLSYRELYAQVQKLAAYMQSELGVKKGDRVAIMMPNLLQYPIAIYAALTLGAIVVNINPLYTARELKHALQDSGARVIFICENFAKTLADIIDEVSLEGVVVTALGDLLGFKGKVINFVVKYIKKMVPAYHINGAVKFNDVLKQGEHCQLNEVPLCLEDLAFLQYTGGTTGPSKGAELTHGNLLANANQFRAWIKSIVVSGEDVAVTPLPLYHIFSLTVCCLAYIGLGAECMLITNPRDIDGFIKILRKRMGTFFVGINTLYNALALHPDLPKVDFSKLKFCGSGGMSTQHAVDQKWFEVTGRHIIEGYGLTETSPVVTFSPTYVSEFSGSIGIPLPNTDVIICDEEGNALPVGQKGELCVKGPQVMRGYWQRPEATQEVMTADGWFKTGDVGLMDKQGWIYLVDRKKDMIIVSGFNVYPNELEKILVEHEGVAEAAVIGVPSEKTGEAVKAFVVKSDPGLTKDDVIAFCRKNMTAYKVPKIIEFIDDLPKTNVGKVLRRALRDI
jgi:long-chain acyl-CoA synthetase